MKKGQIMSGSFARDKGQRGERNAIRVLQPVVNKVYREAGLEKITPIVERNLMQSNLGGEDLAGLELFSFEIKNCEKYSFGDWWPQTLKQAGKTKIPVLMYKKNNAQFRVRMYGYLPAEEHSVKVVVDVAIDDFLRYFENRLTLELKRKGLWGGLDGAGVR